MLPPHEDILPMPYEQLAEATLTIEKDAYHLVKPSVESSEETDEQDEAEKNLWQTVTALKATERLEEAQPGDQVLQIQAISVSGMETTVTFSEYSVDSYLAVVDGGTPLLVAADQIDSLVRAVRTRQ